MPITSRRTEPSDPHSERIRLEQIDALYTNVTVGVLGALMGAVVLVGALIEVGVLSLGDAAAWVAIGCGCVSFHLILRFWYVRVGKSRGDWRLAAYGFVLAAFLDGLWWSYAAVFLAPRDHAAEQFLILTVAFAVAIGALPAFGSYIAAFYAIFMPITLTALVWNLIQGGALHAAGAVLVAVLIVTLSGLARRANANFNLTLRLRFEKDALAEELRSQKERAEAANLSKSRFLAAASHDLRQPIHALGMFVGALSGHAMTEEMRRLVSNIEGSIGAMDGLFSSLLDISKLDAGVVEANLRSFAIEPLLQRISTEFAGEAREKGLELVACKCSLRVYSDPALLERILRNLVANAIRYTDKGRVLIGCRRGERLSIEVWDTGRGIAPSEIPRVFEEFYQVGNSERDREKGLGLGLAIVKRLTVLLDHPLTLKSRLGVGSVFKLSAPIGEAVAAQDASRAPDASPVRLGGLILVIDDETLVQDAMRSLLTSWGSEVIVAGSEAEMLERIADCPDVPDLILCDYRLRADENGVDVIRRIQSEYNEDIPAVLITGDTASERLREARDSGFVVLNKPVANSKLRATLGNVMNKRPRVDIG